MIKKTIKFGIDLTAKYVLIRYIVSGGTSALTDLVLLYIFHHYFGIYYLTAAILAFIIAFFVSFTLHKFWTFKSHEQETHKQVAIYLGVSLFGLGLNTLFMYISVDYFLIPVIVSQIIAGVLVAFCTFFISRNFVFKYKEKHLQK